MRGNIIIRYLLGYLCDNFCSFKFIVRGTKVILGILKIEYCILLKTCSQLNCQIWYSSMQELSYSSLFINIFNINKTINIYTYIEYNKSDRLDRDLCGVSSIKMASSSYLPGPNSYTTI